jgi:hypothetical protein
MGVDEKVLERLGTTESTTLALKSEVGGKIRVASLLWEAQSDFEGRGAASPQFNVEKSCICQQERKLTINRTRRVAAAAQEPSLLPLSGG